MMSRCTNQFPLTSWPDLQTGLVLGANGNLGPLWAREISKAGFTVIGAGAEATAASFTDDDNSDVLSKYIQVDLTAPASISRFFSESTIPKLDLVVINSGVDSVPVQGTSRRHSNEVHEIDLWQETLSVNVVGVAKFLNRSIKHLNRGAKVLFTGSMYSLVSPRIDVYSHMNNGLGWIKNPAYGASKAALNSLCRQYATHLASSEIYFLNVIFGAVLGAQDETFISRMKKHIPSGQLLTEREVSEAISFSLNFPSSLSGHSLVFDGGYTLW